MITSWHVKAFCVITVIMTAVASHRRLDCLLNSLCGRKSKKTSKLYVTGPCEWNSPVTREFPAQRASVAENVSVWWRHHDWSVCSTICVGLHKKTQRNHFTGTLWEESAGVRWIPLTRINNADNVYMSPCCTSDTDIAYTDICVWLQYRNAFE